MYGILTINLNTNIKGFKKIYYKPSMTLKGSSSNAIIYFPENIELNNEDLGGKTSGKHDKIKAFLSLNRLDSIITEKLNPIVSDGAKEKNVKTILKLLFSNDENLFLDATAYTILTSRSSITGLTTSKTLFKDPRTVKSSKSGEQARTPKEIKLYNVEVTLVLKKGEKLSSSEKGCNKQQIIINEKWGDIKDIVASGVATGEDEDENNDDGYNQEDKEDEADKKGKDIDRETAIKEDNKFTIPPGYIRASDWRIVRKRRDFRDKEYYVNIKTGKTQFELPVPWGYKKRLEVWRNTEEYGEAPPPPQSSSVPQGGGAAKTRRHRRNSQGRHNKTLRASPKKISTALKKKDLDGGNISVYFAMKTPDNYFSKKEIASLNN